jgi:hypothetical protein
VDELQEDGLQADALQVASAPSVAEKAVVLAALLALVPPYAGSVPVPEGAQVVDAAPVLALRAVVAQAEKVVDEHFQFAHSAVASAAARFHFAVAAGLHFAAALAVAVVPRCFPEPIMAAGALPALLYAHW